MKQKIINLYTYEELNETAKEKVREWYLDDSCLNDFFYDSCKDWYSINFPNSDLDCHYSLSYCQGDGFNTIGKLDLSDMINKISLPDKERKTLDFYFKGNYITYDFEKDNHYCYSCKDRDLKYLEYTVEDIVSELKWKYHYRDINEELIAKFLKLTFDYFSEVDYNFEKDGYKQLYEVDEDEIQEACEINEWYFTEDGTFCLD